MTERGYNESCLCEGMSNNYTHDCARNNTLIESPKGEVRTGFLRTVEHSPDGVQKLTCKALKNGLCTFTHLRAEGGKKVGCLRGLFREDLLAQCSPLGDVLARNEILNSPWEGKCGSALIGSPGG